MIRVEKIGNDCTEVYLEGDSKTILRELLMTILEVLELFHSQGHADVVMMGLVDVCEQFTSSITNTNFNSKGEEEND